MKIVILTGAGISAESGIETFRSENGLWCNHKVEDVATLEGFIKNPTLVHQFYNQRRRQLLDKNIKPNSAHLALAKLEQYLIGHNHSFLLITQNIDNLHHRAGNQNIISMHGKLLEVYCTNCQKISEYKTDCSTSSVCPHCQKIGSLRPNIVWFGEMPYQLDECYQYLSKCDIFASIGTSGNVYPAAGFVQIANESGAKCDLINLETISSNPIFNNHYIGKASKQVPIWVDSLILELN